MPDSPPTAGNASSPPKADAPVGWYRSLYWRFALGLIGFLALMLAAEGGLFL